MNTLPYVYGIDQRIKIGTELYFGQLWDGDGDGEELLESGSICLEKDKNRMPVIVAFEIAKKANILDTVVYIINIY